MKAVYSSSSGHFFRYFELLELTMAFEKLLESLVRELDVIETLFVVVFCDLLKIPDNLVTIRSRILFLECERPN